MSENDDTQITDQTRAALKHLFSSLPSGYADRYRILSAVRHAFYEELAAALEPSLNAFLKSIPHEAVRDRNDLAALVNDDTRMIGLALRCPRTMRPALVGAVWVYDMGVTMNVEVQVANPNHEAWRWKNVKRKTDKDDALKLAQLSAMNQLPMIQLPSTRVRQWRSLIGYRNTLVARRTAIKNHIRSILDRQGNSWPGGRSGWTDKAIASLRRIAGFIENENPDDLWRFELRMELEAMAQTQMLINRVEVKLDTLAKADARVHQLRTIAGVGPRLAEVIVAVIDDAKRFKNAKQVGAYAGLTPMQFESGTMSRQGGISGRGNKLLRALLVQVSWLGRRCNGKISEIFEDVCRGNKTRRKIAVIATARRLLVICWAMLRDGTTWREPGNPIGALPTS